MYGREWWKENDGKRMVEREAKLEERGLHHSFLFISL
jgi:hypothetical protein